MILVCHHTTFFFMDSSVIKTIFIYQKRLSTVKANELFKRNERQLKKKKTSQLESYLLIDKFNSKDLNARIENSSSSLMLQANKRATLLSLLSQCICVNNGTQWPNMKNSLLNEIFGILDCLRTHKIKSALSFIRSLVTHKKFRIFCKARGEHHL